MDRAAKEKRTMDFIAKASKTIAAPASEVWSALVDPEQVREYMFGTEVASDWKEGGAISWKGEWKGKAYEDKGTVVQVKPRTLLQYTHFSPLAGLPDVPENYHTVTIELAEDGASTNVTLTQDGNATDEAREHSEKNWSMMLDGLKKVIEEKSA
jgi:uncharacterized protein YndB with AHSA1/START domain